MKCIIGAPTSYPSKYRDISTVATKLSAVDSGADARCRNGGSHPIVGWISAENRECFTD